MDIAAAAPMPAPERAPFSIGGRQIDWTPRDVVFGILWFIGAFLVVPLPFVVVAVSIWGRDAAQVSAVALALSMPAQLSLALFAAQRSFRTYGGGWERLGFRNIGWRAGAWALAALIAAFGFALAWGGIVELFDVDALRSSCDEQIPKSVINNNGLLALAGVAIVGFAPICEETFFRGFMFPGIARRWGLAVGVIASAVLFSAGHASLKAFVPIFGIGAIFALTYYRSGSLLSTVIAHLAFNSLSYSVMVTADCK